jgi:hypothetical protein
MVVGIDDQSICLVGIDRQSICLVGMTRIRNKGQELYGMNPDGVVLWGSSPGGLLALLTLFDTNHRTRAVKAAISVYGICSLLPNLESKRLLQSEQHRHIVKVPNQYSVK